MTAPRTWLITGTSSGFGLELTKLLLEQGERVAATARNRAPLLDLKNQYSDLLTIYSLDITDTTAIGHTVKQVFADMDKVDVVVSNAGYGLFGALEELTDEQIKTQFDTNVMGSTHLIRAALPFLREQHSGHIMQLSSMGGQTVMPGFGVYNATKWALESICEGLAMEVAPHNIKVTLIEPGGARTDFAGRSLNMAKAMPEYEDSAAGMMRKRLSDPANEERIKGDPIKMAQAMIECANMDQPPLRLALGSDAYEFIKASLNKRLDQLEANKTLTLSTDINV